MTVQKGPPDFQHGPGNLSNAPLASMLFPGNAIAPQAGGKSFGDKWQQILSAFQASEGSMTNDVQAIAPKSKESTSTSPAIASESQSTGQREPHHASLDRFDADEFYLPKSLGLSAHILVAGGPNLKSVAYSNLRVCNRSKVKTLPMDMQSAEGKRVKFTELHPAGKFNAITPAEVSGYSISPANPLTVESPSTHRPASPDQYGPSHQNTLHRRTASADDALALSVHGRNGSQVEVEDALSESASRDDSVDAALQGVTGSAHDERVSSAAITTSVEKRLTAQTSAEMQDVTVHHEPSNSNTPAGIPGDKFSTAAQSAENATTEDGSRTQVVKTGTRMRASTNPRDLIISTTRATAGSFVTAAHPIQPMETTPLFVGAREAGAQSFASANMAQPGLSVSIESTKSAEKAIETFATIDAQERGPTSQWTFSGSHRAEAGFQDPSLGWISVRAQADAGGIHAVVVPESDGAAQVLGTHLAGLNAHMTPHYEHLNPVTLASPGSTLSGQDTEGHSAQHNDRGSGQSEAQQSREVSQSSRTTQSISTVMGRVETEGAESPAITAGQSPGEQHVSVIV